MTMRIGERIGFNPLPNTHGCSDYAVAVYLGGGQARITEAQSCPSCWPIGHDAAHTFATVGDVWQVDEADCRPAGDNWASSVAWETS